MGPARSGLPAWTIATFLVGSLGVLLLLANWGVVAPASQSWPLALTLIGCAVLMSDARAFLVVGGLLILAGVLLFLHNIERLPLRKNWPLLLVGLAVLLVLHQAVHRRSPPAV